MHDWWLDETKYVGAEHLDPLHVSRYEEKAGYDPAEDLMTLCEYGLGEGNTLIDFGAGTGSFAFAAARAGARVVAVDCSPAMVEAMRAKLRGEAIGTIEIVQAGVLTYQGSATSADFAFSRNALHHLPDFWKGIALYRVRSCLRDGGILLLKDLVFDFVPSESDDAIAQWMSDAASDSSRGYTAKELAVHVRTEFSTYSWLMEPLIEQAGRNLPTTLRHSPIEFSEHLLPSGPPGAG